MKIITVFGSYKFKKEIAAITEKLNKEVLYRFKIKKSYREKYCYIYSSQQKALNLSSRSF